LRTAAAHAAHPGVAGCDVSLTHLGVRSLHSSPAPSPGLAWPAAVGAVIADDLTMPGAAGAITAEMIAGNGAAGPGAPVQ